MTDQEFIQKATKLLEAGNKIPTGKLKDSTVRDAKIIYFKLGDSFNAMMVFDSETGEQFHGAFGSDTLIQGEPQFYAPTRI